MTWQRQQSTDCAAEWITSAAAAFAVIVVAGACIAGEPARSTRAPRLVILYATCSLDAHHLAPYAPDVSFTPAIDAFAKRSLVFERHQTESGQSGIAYASIFSGTQADRHGVFWQPKHLDPSVELITETFARDGWDVHSFLQHKLASRQLGYGQGVPRANVTHGRLGVAKPSFFKVLRRLKRDPEYRALMVTSFSATHRPYRVRDLDPFCGEHPEECGVLTDRETFDRLEAIFTRNHVALSIDFDRRVAALGLSDREVEQMAEVVALLYKARVHGLDRIFGAMLGQLEKHELMDEAIVAFTADHGEVLYRKNAFFQWSHSYQLAPEAMEVPWILHAPSAGVVPGRYSGVTRSIDVFPTLLGLAGGTWSDAAGGGRDLSGVLRGEASPPPLRAYSHSALPSRRIMRKSEHTRVRQLFPTRDPALMWTAVRADDVYLKLQRPPGARDFAPVAYDLSRDRAEAVDIFDPENPTHQELLAGLLAYKRRLVASYATVDDGALSEQDEAKLLRELGYLE